MRPLLDVLLLGVGFSSLKPSEPDLNDKKPHTSIQVCDITMIHSWKIYFIYFEVLQWSLENAAYLTEMLSKLFMTSYIGFIFQIIWIQSNWFTMNNYVVSLTLQCQPHTPSGDMCILKYLQDLDNPVRGSENEQAWNKEYLYHNVKYIRLSWYVSPMINMKHKHIPWANCSV